MSSTHQQWARPLGLSEQYFYGSEKLSPSNCMAMVRVRGGFDGALARAALDALQREEPLLRARVEPGAPPRLLPCAEPIPLRVLRMSGPEDVYRAAEVELDRRLPLHTGPLASAALLEGEAASELVISFHHMIADAKAMAYLTRRVVELADALAAGRAPTPRLPRTCDHLDQALPDAWRAIPLTNEGESFLALPQELLPQAGKATGSEHRAHLTGSELDPSETCRLVQRARAERTTVQGAFIAALMLSIHEYLHPDATDLTRSNIACASAVNLRPMLACDVGQGAGNFSSATLTAHSLNRETRFWDLAREAKAQLTTSLERADPYAVMQKLVPIADDLASMQLSAVMAALVTNIGVVEESRELTRLSYEAFRFAAPTLPSTGNALIAAVSTHGDRMYVTFNYAAGRLADDVAAAVIAKVRARLLSES